MESLKRLWNETNGLFTRSWWTPGTQVVLITQVSLGEVTCDGSPRLSCKRNQVKMRDYMDRWVTPPNRVTSPAWSPPPPCKKALIVLKMKRVSAKNSSEGEGYTSETWRSTLESNGLLAESQRQVTQTDAIANTPPKSGASLFAFSLHRTSLQGNLVSLKVY